ncbi:hypothetical protein Leryth_010403 [Lithospermum erythrorhizon]|nr:hypothetical protein Leryth_010403 [Lithospermum erythrorhizon]
MEANKNKWIEEWGTARENLEHNFRWTRRNFAIIGIFGIAVPVLVYKGIVRELYLKFPPQINCLFLDSSRASIDQALDVCFLISCFLDLVASMSQNDVQF